MRLIHAALSRATFVIPALLVFPLALTVACGDAAQPEPSSSHGGKKPFLVRTSQDASATAQAAGMEWRPVISADTAGSSKIWMGLFTVAPNEVGSPHHHGDAETASYVLSGRVRVHFGENFEEFVEAGPGDFLFIPANTPHMGVNPYDEPWQAVLSRSPDNIIVNLGE